MSSVSAADLLGKVYFSAFAFANKKLEDTMRQTLLLPRYILALSLLILLALLAVSCGGNSDSTTSEDSVIAAGDVHTCALRQTGTITCWGWNEYGQLGNDQAGEGSSSNVPVEVPGITDTTAITAGSDHTCALRQTGTITCWGANGTGKLGNGTTNDSSVPVEVLGINDAAQISAGGGHTCALRRTGSITCWGWNEYGELGNGQAGEGSSSNVPVEVQNMTDATAITAGGSHTCALRRTGSIACWGLNEYGQLGNGTTNDSSVPAEVPGINDATAITASGHHTCALRRTGAIACWGLNDSGELGNGQSGEYLYSSVPVEVVGITDATAITTGNLSYSRFGSHSCALRRTGTIACWGNNSGELGDGTETNSSVPVEVLNITDATAITGGHWHTCALLQTGTITCWGNNDGGQLGNGTTDSSSEPVEVLG